MASTRNNKATGRSRQNRSNLYDRLEDARNRRAEVLAHKPAANDVARRPLDIAHHQEETPSAERFPKIVMPPPDVPDVPVAETLPPKRRSKWPIVAFAGLIAAAILVLFVATPPGVGPQPGIAVAALDAPLDGAAASTFATSTDTPLAARQTAHLVPAAVPDADAQYDQPGPQPQALVRVRDVSAPNGTEPVDALRWLETPFNQGQGTTLALAPINELPFTFDLPVSLRVSLNIPVQSRQSDINAVLQVLDQSPHEVSPPRRVNFVVRSTQVRFFHESDSTAARELADEIGGVARDFTDFSPAPPNGLVEVYVAGSSVTAPPPPARRGIAGDIRRLTEDIGNALRSIAR